MNNSLAIFLILSVASLAFILGIKFAPRPQVSTITTITIVDAPRPVLPIQSKPSKPVPPRIDTVYIDKLIKDSTVYLLLSEYSSEFDLRDSSGQALGTMTVVSRPSYRDAILTDYKMFPIPARVESVKYGYPEYSLDYKSALIYLGVGVVAGILIERTF